MVKFPANRKGLSVDHGIYLVVSRLIGPLYGFFQFLDRSQPSPNDIHWLPDKAVAISMHSLSRFRARTFLFPK